MSNSDTDSWFHVIEKARELHTSGSYDRMIPADVRGDGVIWIGSMFDATNSEWLCEKGITHVVNCAQPLTNYAKRVSDTHIREVLVLEAEDAKEYMILDKHLDDVTRFCDAAFSFSSPESPTRILFHCMAGINRSATLALAYSASQSSDCARSRLGRFATVFANVMGQRPAILTNEDFYNQLLIWAQL